MQYLNNKDLKQATIDIIKSKPKITFERVKNDSELKKGIYIIIYNDSQSVAYNLFAYVSIIVDTTLFLFMLAIIFSLLFIIV